MRLTLKNVMTAVAAAVALSLGSIAAASASVTPNATLSTPVNLRFANAAGTYMYASGFTAGSVVKSGTNLESTAWQLYRSDDGSNFQIRVNGSNLDVTYIPASNEWVLEPVGYSGRQTFTITGSVPSFPNNSMKVNDSNHAPSATARFQPLGTYTPASDAPSTAAFQAISTT